MSLPDPSNPSDRPSLIAHRSSLALAAAFALAAILPPLCFHGTEAGNVAWAWFLFFALQSVLVLSNPSIFLAS